MAERTYLSQGVDYVDWLRTQLQGMLGMRRVALELVQNADDGDAEWIEFDFRDDALVVSNSREFRGCDNVKASHCPWEDGVTRPCDFHSLRRVAGGSKRKDRDTIGEFGVGFVAVYGICDQPRIRTGCRGWTMHPLDREERRIEEELFADHEDRTVITLPWAFAESETRQRLAVLAVDRASIDAFVEEAADASCLALLFLRNLQRIVVKRGGSPMYSIEKSVGDGRNPRECSLQCNGTQQLWLLYESDFAEQARELAETDGIACEALSGRESKAEIALTSDGMQGDGLLFAGLPTEDRTRLAFHVNARFFPTPDRRSVLLDGGHQRKWNQAALSCAAEIFAASAPDIGRRLGAKALFTALDSAYREREYPHFGVFWKAVHSGRRDQAIVYRSDEEWGRPADVRLLRDPDEEAAIPALCSVDIAVAHPDIRPYRNVVSALGSKELTFGHLRSLLVDRLSAAGRIEDAPACLRDPHMRHTLYDEVTRLYGRRKKPQPGYLRSLPITASLRGEMLPVGDARRADDATQQLFAFAGDDIPFADTLGRSPDDCKVVEAIPAFGAEDAVTAVEKHASSAPDGALAAALGDTESLRRLHSWFTSRREDFEKDQKLRKRYMDLPVFPTGSALAPLSELSLPSKSFRDPLEIARVLDVEDVGPKVLAFWRELDVQDLDTADYIKRHLKPHLERPQHLPPGSMQSLITQLAESLNEYREDADAMQTLGALRLCECIGGEHVAPNQVYFRTQTATSVLGDDVPYLAADPSDMPRSLHKWHAEVGVAELPRPADVVARVERLVCEPPNDDRRAAIGRVLVHLDKQWEQLKDDDRRALAQLKTMAWLPATDDRSRWFAPAELYTPNWEPLCASQAHFLHWPRELGHELLVCLGARREPSVREVVDHLLWSAQESVDVDDEVYKYLESALDEDGQELRSLQDKPCVKLEDGKYECASRLFWRPHGLGRWRKRLDGSWRRFTRLLGELGAREEPEAHDFVDVLLEIEGEFGLGSQLLDDEALDVVQHCFACLSKAPAGDPQAREILSRLADHKVVPNPETRLLYSPGEVYLDDKFGFRDKFGGQLDEFVIPKERDTFPALHEIGVRGLSTVVAPELARCTDPRLDREFTARVRERSPAILRIVERQKGEHPAGWRPELVARLDVYQVTELRVSYVVPPLGIRSHEEQRHAFLQDGAKPRLYVTGPQDEGLFPEAARELAFALNPHVDTCNIVSTIENVLRAESPEAAQQYLLTIGYDDIREGGRPDALPPDEIVEALGRDGTSPEEAPETQVEPTSSPSLEQQDHASRPADGETSVSRDQANGDQAEPAARGAARSSRQARSRAGAGLDYAQALRDETSRPGDSSLAERPPSPGPLSDPDRRRDRVATATADARQNEPEPSERLRTVARIRWEPKNADVREFLRQQYGGHCQICGYTFPKRDGQPYFEGVYLVSYTEGRWIDTPGNALCLCANCSAKWEHGSRKAKEFPEQVLALDPEQDSQEDQLSVAVELCGQQRAIRFTGRHVIEVQSLIRSSESSRDIG